MDVARRKRNVAWLSVASNTSLVVGKLVIGLAIGSVSVISEAIHSAVDLVAAVIALLAVRAASRPPDFDHPYGHGKWENVSGTVEALLIFGAAGWIGWEAVHKLRAGTPVTSPGLGVAVMGLSALVNVLVSARLFQVGQETDSVALQADAWHLRTDVWTSAGVMVGLAVISLGHWLLPGTNLAWIDPVAALAVALLIVKAAWDLTRQSLRDVLDTSLPPDELAWIREQVVGHPGVKGMHALRTRKAGAERFVDFHVLVDGAMSTADSHALADELTRRLRVRFPEANVSPHVEPCLGQCTPRCLAGCTLSEPERARQRRDPA